MTLNGPRAALVLGAEIKVYAPELRSSNSNGLARAEIQTS
jgi:hypothetical protein